MDQENKRYLSARLKARMDECFDAGLSVVRAPAGFGKSVSVEEYFRRYVSAVSRVFWLTCDGMSEAMYCEKFCDSIAQADPAAAQKLRAFGTLNQLIAGWQQGIPGMKVGGRRQLICPPALAYGPAGGGHRLSGRTLTFVIDLLGVS